MDQNWNSEEVSLITIPKQLRSEHPFEQLIVDKRMMNGEEVSLITIPKPLRKLAKKHPFEQLIVDKGMINGEEVSLITIPKPLRKLAKNHPFEQLIVDKEMMNGEDVSLITIRKPLRKLEKQQQKNNKTAATLIKVCRFPKKENMDDNKIEEIQKQRESSEQITGHKMLVSEDMTLLQICESPKVLELLARCRRHEHEMSRLIPAPGVYRYANK